jgi:hypothetical protein|tara:strand:- start:233 stop:556 length:324 start_codon:yes stop_codon:yes gene_type:complete
MAGNITAFPKLPIPNQEVDIRYLTDLVRALESFINQVQNPGPQRGTAQTLTNLQYGNDVGLEAGALYVSNCINTTSSGYVRISLLDVSACKGSEATTSVGSVTVAVS